jgi:hypothetical protein
VTEQHLRVVQVLVTAAMADAGTPAFGGRGLARGQAHEGRSAAKTDTTDQQVNMFFCDTVLLTTVRTAVRLLASASRHGRIMRPGSPADTALRSHGLMSQLYVQYTAWLL